MAYDALSSAYPTNNHCILNCHILWEQDHEQKESTTLKMDPSALQPLYVHSESLHWL